MMRHTHPCSRASCSACLLLPMYFLGQGPQQKLFQPLSTLNSSESASASMHPYSWGIGGDGRELEASLQSMPCLYIHLLTCSDARGLTSSQQPKFWGGLRGSGSGVLQAHDVHGLLFPDESWLEWDQVQALISTAARRLSWEQRDSRLLFRGAPTGDRTYWLDRPEV